MTFPPPPIINAPRPPPPLSSSPSSVASRAAANALNRALSIASKKLFGHTTSARATPSTEYPSSVPASPRRPLISLNADATRDPLEDDLLALLEELAQKTDVLTHWADEMYEYVKAIPQSASFCHNFAVSFSAFVPFALAEPLADPTKFEKREGEADKQARKRKHADMEAEYNAVTCVAVYMLLMSFSQKGIDKLRNFQEHMKMRHPDGDFVVSEGFDMGASSLFRFSGQKAEVPLVALNWFKEHFVKCNDRAELVRTWLPVTYDGPKSWLDQLVYDRALMLVRRLLTSALIWVNQVC